ncbi:MAG: hypothetical protein DCC75_00250 [Proteobacteria bacterium]|nr:MAG: hypothetical protein DCC75_00250 [Pseudomonadota bacterium]
MRKCSGHWSRAAGVILAVGFFFAAEIRAEEAPFKSGLSMPLSGPWANWGEPVKNGMLLATENTQNKLRIDFQDDGCEPKRALTNFIKFLKVDKNKINFLGCIESVDAVAPLVGKEGGVLLTLGGMTEDVLMRYPHVQGLYALVDTEARYVIPYLKEELGISSIAIVGHEALFGEIFSGSLEKLAKRYGMFVTRRERLPLELTDFRSVIARVVKDNPQAVAVHIGEGPQGSFIKQLRANGYKGLVIAGFTFESEEVRKAGGDSLDGVLYTYPLNEAADQTAYLEFARRYEERFGSEPNNNAAMAYDIALLLDRALNKCGRSDPPCVLDYFATLGTFNGVGGSVTIDQNRSPTRPYGIKTFKADNYQWVTRKVAPYMGSLGG